MKQLSFLVISTLLCLTSCQNNSGFVYDPTVPYPLLDPGDFWPDHFDQRGLQNAVIYKDRLYCNTIDVGGKNNFLYCLNPKTGLVIWRAQVDAYASQPASFQDDRIIYCSYLGDIAVFNNRGELIWKAKFGYPYAGHWVDTNNSKLLVKTVSRNDVAGYDMESGQLISTIESDSLKRLVEIHRKNERLEEHEYRFTKMRETYTIKCRPPGPGEMGEYIIEISKQL